MNHEAKEFRPSWIPAPTSQPVSDSPPPAPKGPITIGKSSGKPVSIGKSLSAGKPVYLSAEKSVSVPVSSPVPTPTQVETSEDGNDDEDEDIDENDPLWKVTLKIAKGNKEEALKLLEDPDALMIHPEVAQVLGEVQKTSANENTDGLNMGQEHSLTGAVTVVAPEPKADNVSSIVDKVLPLSISDDSSSNLKEACDDELITKTVDTGDAKECDPREHLNMVFIGHVDAGKSTLSGSILYLMGMVDARTIEKFEREAKQRNRDSWFLAFILDTSEEERAKGKTVEVGRAFFYTETHRYTILDAPGHKNYVPNMRSGAAQADVGVLVISARKGEFETGFEKGGQTREHALLQFDLLQGEWIIS